MSLFDRDSSLSSSSAASSNGEDEGTLPVRAPPVRPTASHAGSTTSPSTSGPLTLLEQRRRMAEADAASGRRLGTGSAPWRRELLRNGPGSSSIHPAGSASANTTAEATTALDSTKKTGDASKFGGSIAAAMNLRKEEKEKMLLKRLQQQRSEEARGGDGKALAQKDLEVGVFVTASYRALLQRNIQPPAKASGTTDAEDTKAGLTDKGKRAHGGDKSDSDEENDPLSAYLRQLEGQKQVGRAGQADTAAAPASPSTSGDYYDQIMKAPLQEQRQQEEEERRGLMEEPHMEDTADRGRHAAPDASPAPPTIAELQDLIGGPPLSPSASNKTPFTALEPHSKVAAGPVSSPSVEEVKKDATSAELVHAQLVYDTREARRNRAASDATLLACARRCDDRIASSLFCM